jgi:hypothetical protein
MYAAREEDIFVTVVLHTQLGRMQSVAAKHFSLFVSSTYVPYGLCYSKPFADLHLKMYLLHHRLRVFLLKRCETFGGMPYVFHAAGTEDDSSGLTVSVVFHCEISMFDN